MAAPVFYGGVSRASTLLRDHVTYDFSNYNSTGALCLFVVGLGGTPTEGIACDNNFILLASHNYSDYTSVWIWGKIMTGTEEDVRMSWTSGTISGYITYSLRSYGFINTDYSMESIQIAKKISWSSTWDFPSITPLTSGDVKYIAFLSVDGETTHDDTSNIIEDSGWFRDDNSKIYMYSAQKELSTSPFNFGYIVGENSRPYVAVVIAFSPVEALNFNTNIGGVWKKADEVHINIGGVWKKADEVHINIGGVWKKSK